MVNPNNEAKIRDLFRELYADVRIQGETRPEESIIADFETIGETIIANKLREGFAFPHMGT